MTFASGQTLALGGSLVVYVLGLYALCFRFQRRIETTEDFLVAGRKLAFPFATATILATWFGAGTVLTAADEVRRTGLQSAALEPLGAGVCLLIAAFTLAAPIWRMKLLTLSDLFLCRFDKRAELLSALIMVPSYFGWVAAQFVALAGLLELSFGLDLRTGIILVAVVGGGYTLLGGMWSVTITDSIQMLFVLVGLVVLGIATLETLGDGSITWGLVRLWRETPPELREPVPIASAQRLIDWLGVLAIGALGNLPSQDLIQRVSASRTAAVAKRACFWSGALYIFFGLIPVGLGLAGRILMPASLDNAVLPALAQAFTHPATAIVFTLMLSSAVLSSIDSGILAPAAVLSQHVFRYFASDGSSSLTLNRVSVGIVTAASVAMAFAGQSAYSLLEDAYELPLVALFVPMFMAIYRSKTSAAAAVAAMSVGSASWLLHHFAGWSSFFEPWTASWGLSPPSSLASTAASLLAYLFVERLYRRSLAE